jgi:hypothetical protein
MLVAGGFCLFAGFSSLVFASALLSAWTIGKKCCILAPIAITASESSKDYDQIRREII